MNGVFAVRKPVGPTSQDVVSKLKHIFTKLPEVRKELQKNQDNGGKNRGRRSKPQKFIKIGHGGTLDPLADGVLVIGVGSGTKQLESHLKGSTKTYTATCLFGASTTTYDSEGKVLGWGSVENLTNEKVQEALAKFRGTISQIPPVFSALKMDGRPLYEYARLNIPLPRAIEARECTVSELVASPLQWEHSYKYPTDEASEQERKFAFDVTGEDPGQPDQKVAGPVIDLTFSVTSGTYIRSLIHDLGHSLGTQAHMVRLTRDTQGDWDLTKNVLPLDLFERPQDVWWSTAQRVLEDGSKTQLDLKELEELSKPAAEAATEAAAEATVEVAEPVTEAVQQESDAVKE